MSSFRKKLAAFLAVVMAFTGIIVMPDTTYAQDLVSGTMGSNIQWELDLTTGKLVIKGSGAITDNISESVGQDNFDKVKEIEVCSGITSLPNGAFATKLLPKQNTDDSSIGSSVSGSVSGGSYGNSNYKPYTTWASVEKITIADGINCIPGGAFYGLINLKEVTIPSSVQAVGNYAFYDCKSLTTVALPENVEYIGEHAFENSGIVTIDIPDKVSGLGISAFANCQSLENVDLPAAMNFEQYTPALFANCTKLYDENNNLIIDGILFSVDRDAINASGTKELVLPEGITTIIPSVFKTETTYTYNPEIGTTQPSTSSVEVEKVVLPSTIEKIGQWAFNRTPIKEVTIPASVKYLGTYAFGYCEDLEKVVVNEGVTEISDSAFSGCSKLTSLTLPSTLKYIGEYTFSNCGLKELTLPASVEEIGTYAFSYSENIEKVNIGNNVKIGYDAFLGCTNLADEHGSVVINGVFCGTKHSYNSETKKYDPIYISKNVTDIATSVLESEFQDVVIDDANKNFSLEDGSLYSKDGKIWFGLVDKTAVFNEKEDVYNIKVKSGCETIKYCTLSECTYHGMTGCVYEVPASVTNINNGKAFYSYGMTYKVIGGSYAAQYAKAHDYKVEVSGDISDIAPLPQGAVLGDANSDGKVNLNDAKTLLKAALGIMKLESKVAIVCDVDFSGKVDLKDAKILLKAALGIIKLNMPSFENKEYEFDIEESKYTYNAWSNKTEMRFDPTGKQPPISTGGIALTGDSMAEKMPLLIVTMAAMIVAVVTVKTKKREEA